MMGNADPSPVHPVVYNQITASCLRSVALHVKCAAGPSGLDVHCCERLCTLLAKRLCTILVDPKAMSPLLASPFIALDKCPGVRPIGIRETHRRIIAKAVLLITRSDIQDALVQDNCVQGKSPGLKQPYMGCDHCFLVRTLMQSYWLMHQMLLTH